QAGKDFGAAGKIQTPLLQGLGALRFVPAKSHIIYVPPKIKWELNRRKRVAGARQGFAGAAAVVLHLPDEVVCRIEDRFVAQPFDESDVDARAVTVAGKIEQEDLKQHAAVVEHRPPAKARDA